MSWWRPPYVASFRSGDFEFIVAAAHIRWGTKISRRAEIEMLADWAVQYANATATSVRDVLLVGDFNLPGAKSETFRVLGERGIAVPAALADVFGTDLARGKRYHQILVVTREGSASTDRFTGRGGALDFYARSHPALYTTLGKVGFTFEMSDHFSLWVEVRI